MRMLCPQCGYPVAYTGPDNLLYDKCPVCGIELGKAFKQHKQYKKEARILNFLSSFFDPPHLIKKGELADFLQVSEFVVRKQIKMGNLEAIDLSTTSEDNNHHLYRFQPYHVFRFLENQTVSES